MLKTLSISNCSISKLSQTDLFVHWWYFVVFFFTVQKLCLSIWFVTLEQVAEDQEEREQSWRPSKPNYTKMCVSIPLGESCGCFPERDRHKQPQQRNKRMKTLSQPGCVVLSEAHRHSTKQVESEPWMKLQALGDISIMWSNGYAWTSKTIDYCTHKNKSS